MALAVDVAQWVAEPDYTGIIVRGAGGWDLEIRRERKGAEAKDM